MSAYISAYIGCDRPWVIAAARIGNASGLPTPRTSSYVGTIPMYQLTPGVIPHTEAYIICRVPDFLFTDFSVLTTSVYYLGDVGEVMIFSA